MYLLAHRSIDSFISSLATRNMTLRNAMCFVVSSHSHSKRIGNGTSAGAIKQLLSNPEDIPGLVAVRCDVDGSTDALEVELLYVNKLDISGGWKSGGTPGTTPASSTFIGISTTERSILTYHSTDYPGLPNSDNSQSGYNREISLHLLLQVQQHPSRLSRCPLTRAPSRPHPSLGSPISYSLLSVSLQTN